MSPRRSSLSKIVDLIHDSPHQMVLAVTGGGISGIAALFEQPGASRTILQVIVPYHPSAFSRWLGFVPEQFCSQATARAMAAHAFQQACALAPEASSWLGLGSTASLVTDRPKRGSHRVHVTFQTPEFAGCYSLHFIKGARTRAQEEKLAGRVILYALADGCGAKVHPHLPLTGKECLLRQLVPAGPGWTDLYLGKTDKVLVGGEAALFANKPPVLLPGSFNPFHLGHLEMLRYGSRRFGLPAALELSIFNVDKPPLDFCSIHERLSAIGNRFPVWLTRAPTFVEKTRQFPKAIFLIGADTLARIVDPKYYRGDEQARDAALRQMVELGCRFVVFGRKFPLHQAEQALENFVSLTDLPVPRFFRAICEEVPEHTFRIDISSTELRALGKTL